MTKWIKIRLDYLFALAKIYFYRAHQNPLLVEYAQILNDVLDRGADPTDTIKSLEYIASCINPNTPTHELSLKKASREISKFAKHIDPSYESALFSIDDRVCNILKERGYGEDILTYQEHRLLASTQWIGYGANPYKPIGVINCDLTVSEANKARELEVKSLAFGNYFGLSEDKMVKISLEPLDEYGNTIRDPQLLDNRLKPVVWTASLDYPFRRPTIQ